MPAQHLTRFALPVVAALLVLTGCSGSSPDDDAAPTAEPTTPRAELTAGTCWTAEQLPQALGGDGFADWTAEYADGDERLAEAMKDDASFREQVDCAEPHALELYAMVGLPPALDRRVSSYADLLDPTTPLAGRVRDAVNARCLADSVWGRAQSAADAPAVQLGPALRSDGGLRLAWDPVPADLWADGQRQFVCTLEQASPGTLMFDDLATAEVPTSERVCLDIPGRQVPCGRPHQAEEIGEMVLNTAIADGDIDARRAERRGGDGPYVALSDREYERLDAACSALLSRVSTGRPDLEAQSFPGAVDQWPTDDGVYVASCFALKPFDPPPKFRGTVFDR